MTNEEATAIYQSLLEVLESLELMWVVEQLNEQINFGKVEEVRITSRGIRSQSTDRDSQNRILSVETQLINIIEDVQGTDRSVSDASSASNRISGTYARTIEYNPKEKLLILIETIERTVIDTIRTESYIIDFFRGEGNRLGIGSDIYFSQENSDQILIFNDTSIPENTLQNASELRSLLVHLRAEVSRVD